MSSNAMIMKRRQIAEPFCARNVSAARRDIDFASSDRFLKKAFDDPLICNERFKNRWFTIKADGQSVFCFGKYVAHQCLRAVKRTADVNFDRREDNKIAKFETNNAEMNSAKTATFPRGSGHQYVRYSLNSRHSTSALRCLKSAADITISHPRLILRPHAPSG